MIDPLLSTQLCETQGPSAGPGVGSKRAGFDGPSDDSHGDDELELLDTRAPKRRRDDSTANLVVLREITFETGALKKGKKSMAWEVKRDLIAVEYANIELEHRTLELKYKTSKLKHAADASRIGELEKCVAALEAMVFRKRQPTDEQGSAAVPSTKAPSRILVSRTCKGEKAVGRKTTDSGLSRSGGGDHLDPDRTGQVTSSVPKGTREADGWAPDRTEEVGQLGLTGAGRWEAQDPT